MKKAFTLKNTSLALSFLFLSATLHYFLPQVDVVRVVGTEIKLVDSVNPETQSAVTRDTYRIQTETLTGRPSVYRNEDVFLLAKIDAADLQAQMQSLAADKSIVAIRHYGWRIRILSMFPNALSAWPVEEDYRHIPVFNIIFLLLLVGGASWTVMKLRHRRAARDKARKEAAAQAISAAAAAERATKDKNDRSDIDSFLNSND